MCISATVYSAKFAYRLVILSIPGSPLFIIIITIISIIKYIYIAENRVMQPMRCCATIISCYLYDNRCNAILIMMGYDFTGVKFPIFLLIFAWALQQCSAKALPVMM